MEFAAYFVNIQNLTVGDNILLPILYLKHKASHFILLYSELLFLYSYFIQPI